MKSKRFQEPLPPQSSCSWNQSLKGSTEPAHRTDSPPGCVDPGGGGDRPQPPRLENKSVLELKRSQQQRYGPGGGGGGTAAGSGQTHYEASQPQQPPHLDTDSALEAAVNSILEC